MKSIILTPSGTVDEYIYVKEIKTYIKRTCILELSIEEITGKEGLELQKLRHK